MRQSKSARFLSVILTLACLLGLLVVPALPARAAEPENPFTDVPAGTDYTEAILWAASNGFVEGYGDGRFGYKDDCTEAQILTMLWRVQGKPEVTETAPVNASDSYRKAVNWAYAQGLIDDTFYYRAQCTRVRAVWFIWKIKGAQSPAAASGFTDVPEFYADAVSWAVANGITKGTSATTFDPNGSCQRRIIATFLYRAYGLDSKQDLLPLQSRANWSGASRFGAGDYFVAKPLTGWARGCYTIDNGDGTVSGLVVGSDGITVETFAVDGSLVSTKTLELELPIFGAFLDSGNHFYLAFGQTNPDEDDSREVFRVVQYDRNWNRLGSVSVNGKDSYTTEPFRSAVARMAVSGDGKTVTLYAARQRYTSSDGLRHQSNITISMDVKPFRIQKVMGEQYPSNHVSHSFGQFIRYDGNTMVTVDHGDAYPRSFVLQKSGQQVNLLKIYGSTEDNVTNAIGSGFEVSDDGYLFLGCSNPQDGSSGPWNVFLTYVPKQLTPPTPPWPEGSTNTSMELLENGYWRARWTVDGITWTWTFSPPANDTDAVLTWLTRSETTINTARLVKLDGNTFVAMWAEADGVHWLKLDGKGNRIGEEQVMSGALMPPTDPVVIDGDICWIQNQSTDYAERNNVFLYRLEVE